MTYYLHMDSQYTFEEIEKEYLNFKQRVETWLKQSGFEDKFVLDIKVHQDWSCSSKS